MGVGAGSSNTLILGSKYHSPFKESKSTRIKKKKADPRTEAGKKPKMNLEKLYYSRK